MEDIDETLEDEDLDDEPDDAPEAEVKTPSSVPATSATGDADVESIQDILVKQEAAESEEEADEEDSVLSLSREERLEPLATKVVPPQPTEFICQNCYLVKHRSQLKDKAKMLCRDCA